MNLYTFGASHTEGFTDMSFQTFIDYKDWLGVNSVEEMPPTWGKILSEKLNCDSYENFAKGAVSNQEILIEIGKQSSKFKKGDKVIINWASTLRTMWVKENQFLSISPQHKIREESLTSIPNITETFKNISDNRQLPHWLLETQGYESLIDTLAKSIGFEVYYWFTDDVLLSLTRQFSKEFENRKYLLHDLIEKHYGDIIHEILYHEMGPQIFISFNEKFAQDLEKIRGLIFKSPMYCIFFDILHQYGATTLLDETNGDVQDKYHLGKIGHKVQAELFYSYITNTPYSERIIT